MILEYLKTQLRYMCKDKISWYFKHEERRFVKETRLLCEYFWECQMESLPLFSLQAVNFVFQVLTSLSSAESKDSVQKTQKCKLSQRSKSWYIFLKLWITYSELLHMQYCAWQISADNLWSDRLKFTGHWNCWKWFKKSVNQGPANTTLKALAGKLCPRLAVQLQQLRN